MLASHLCLVCASRSELSKCLGRISFVGAILGVRWIGSNASLGLSPDGGSGVTEPLLLVALCMMVAVLLDVRLFIGRVPRRRREHRD